MVADVKSGKYVLYNSYGIVFLWKTKALGHGVGFEVVWSP